MSALAGSAAQFGMPRTLSGIPTLPAGTVDRPRLDQALDEGQNYPLTLICAPAGSGKSVVAGAWARRRLETAPVAWLNCRTLADDPSVFWSSVVAALSQAVGRRLVRPAMRNLRDPAELPGLLEELLGSLALQPVVTTLVCDDFGDVGAAATQGEMQYLVDRLPDQVRVMIITRSYPPLAVHRARLEGRLLDIRSSELAFTREETDALLSIHDIELSHADVDLLQQRTEGWAAGLRLAAMAMMRASDASEVIQRLADSTEVVSGYLTEQVLARLRKTDRDFLLDTCVVDELSPELAQWLTEGSGTQPDLEQTADRIGFLNRADSDPTYRFHPMFAQLLRTELAHTDPHRFRVQHRRAARWYEVRRLPVLAVRHAQSAEDWDQAARLLALSALSLVFRGRLAELIKLLAGFPHDVAAEDPRLALVQAIPAVFGNDLERATMLLDRARAALPRGTDLDSRRLAAITTYVTTIISRYNGDNTQVLAALYPAGPNIPGPDDSGFDRSDLDLRAAWRSTRAVALMWEDQRELASVEARLACLDVRAGAAGWPMVAALGVRAWLNALDGHLVATDAVLEEIAEYTDQNDPSASPYAGLADFAAAWVAMERAQLDEAGRLLARAEGRWREVTSSGAGVTGQILQARLMLLEGGPSAAVDMLDSAFDRGPRLRGGLLRRLEAWVRVEIWLSRGDSADAVEAARGGGRGLEAYVRARAGTAPLADVTYGDHDLGLQLRTLLTHAIALHQLGRLEGADQCLDAVLDLAAAEGYRLPFLQQGARAHALLIDGRVAAARHGSLVAELLGTTAPHGGRGVELTDPLSPRELDVLRHLVAGMDTDEIAGDLFVSRNTVRTHTKSIYRKLSVQNKRDATLKAAALGIV